MKRRIKISRRLEEKGGDPDTDSDKRRKGWRDEGSGRRKRGSSFLLLAVEDLEVSRTDSGHAWRKTGGRVKKSRSRSLHCSGACGASTCTCTGTCSCGGRVTILRSSGAARPAAAILGAVFCGSRHVPGGKVHDTPQRVPEPHAIACTCTRTTARTLSVARPQHSTG